MESRCRSTLPCLHCDENQHGEWNQVPRIIRQGRFGKVLLAVKTSKGSGLLADALSTGLFFCNRVAVEIFWIQTQSLPTVRADMFQGLTFVIPSNCESSWSKSCGASGELHLTSSGIRHVESGAFRGMKLNLLDLHRNQLTRIAAGMFNGIEWIWWRPKTSSHQGYGAQVDLSRNFIQTIEDGVFNGVDLQNLKLNENWIHTLTAANFRGLFDRPT